jgi:AbrB family looped-hinge helix DNA binding protein
MRITSKGQVTIPQDIRERAGFLPNTDVDFVLDGDLVYLVKSSERARRPSRGDRAVAALRQHGRGITMSTDEIMALTRGEG